MRWRLLARLGGIGLYLAFGWIVGLGCLVVGALRVARFAWRLGLALRPTVRCADGHETPVYARWRCRDHVYDGWAFRCPVCAEWAGHVRCATCGLTAVNPLVRE